MRLKKAEGKIMDLSQSAKNLNKPKRQRVVSKGFKSTSFAEKRVLAPDTKLDERKTSGEKSFQIKLSKVKFSSQKSTKSQKSVKSDKNHNLSTQNTQESSKSNTQSDKSRKNSFKLTAKEYKNQLKSYLKGNEGIKIDLEIDKEAFLRDSGYALSIMERNQENLVKYEDNDLVKSMIINQDIMLQKMIE